MNPVYSDSFQTAGDDILHICKHYWIPIDNLANYNLNVTTAENYQLKLSILDRYFIIKIKFYFKWCNQFQMLGIGSLN